MKGTPFSERIVASIGFSERQSGLHDAHAVVQFPMPAAASRLFRGEARCRGTEVNTLVRDVIWDALSARGGDSPDHCGAG